MVSILGLDEARGEELCAAARQGEEVLRVANYLCPGNLVVSGHRTACDRIEPMAQEAGGRTVRLAVAGAFHTSLMQPAAAAMAEAFATTKFGPARIPVWSNVTAQPHPGPLETGDLLRRQIVEPVRWEQTVRGLLAAGYDRFYEIGPGRVLAGLLKRVQRKVDCQNVSA
jgi:[acyl-carrier-protein] S-malonyltransferase